MKNETSKQHFIGTVKAICRWNVQLIICNIFKSFPKISKYICYVGKSMESFVHCFHKNISSENQALVFSFIFLGQKFDIFFCFLFVVSNYHANHV